MSLIRCLGPVKIPLAYRKFLRHQLNLFEGEYASTARALKGWMQACLYPAYDPMNTDTFQVTIPLDLDDCLAVQKPLRSPRLTQELSRFCSGRQEHNLMTLVETDEHADTEDGFRAQYDQAIVIPVRLDPSHRFEIEGKSRQIEVGMMYSFNQKKLHRLYIDDDTIPFNGGHPAPAQLIVVGYDRENLRGKVRQCSH
ncbi:hypothetical protein ACYPKM_00035 [Pseudomonas aeruginosa]